MLNEKDKSGDVYAYIHTYISENKRLPTSALPETGN
jgi:hypothetical protein